MVRTVSHPGYRAVLRARQACRKEWGGCGAERGQPCRTRDGRPTQPHQARWNADREVHAAGLSEEAAPPKHSVYRCQPCGHGGNLYAWATILACGPLGADGQLDAYDWDEQAELHEGSIQCSRHPDAPLEKFIDGRWCEWWSCSRCHGAGRYNQTYSRPDGVRCPEEGIIAADGDGERRTHSGWLPPGQEVSSINKLGHEYRDGQVDVCCLRCGCHATSISAERECRGHRL